MNILAFDIAQFFSLFNYQLLLSILNKAGFDLKFSVFFSNYLISKKIYGTTLLLHSLI